MGPPLARELLTHEPIKLVEPRPPPVDARPYPRPSGLGSMRQYGLSRGQWSAETSSSLTQGAARHIASTTAAFSRQVTQGPTESRRSGVRCSISLGPMASPRSPIRRFGPGDPPGGRRMRGGWTTLTQTIGDSILRSQDVLSGSRRAIQIGQAIEGESEIRLRHSLGRHRP